MSQLTAYGWETQEQPAPEVPSLVEPLQRSIIQPILLAIPLMLAASSYAIGGFPLETDLAFVILTALCCIFFMTELYRFSERFGIAGILLYGGVITWFSYDYFIHWFLASIPHWEMPIDKEVIAKSAACHMLYIMCVSIGIRFRFGKWVPKALASLPEPRHPSAYFWIMLITQFIGLGPYSYFTSEPFYLALYHQMTAGRTGGAAWIAGRTGNANYSWGAYIAQLLQIGEGGAILASFCIVFLRQNIFRNVVCIIVWLTWVLLELGTGTRGETLFLLLPVLAFLFIRFHVSAQDLLRRFAWRAYVALIVGLLVIIALVQMQIRYRGEGFHNVSLDDVSYKHLEGNSMFSEGLTGFRLIPEAHNYFYDTYPGEAMVLPIPNVIFWGMVAPMPRALWTSKPLDPAMGWYNSVATGGNGTAKVEGTTVSQGIVGYWFFRYGVVGVIEGGMFMGWLMGVTERTLLNNRGRPMAVLAALGLATWIFRAFRDFSFPELVECVVAIFGLVMITFFLRPFLPGGQPQVATEDAGGYEEGQ